MKNPIAVGIGLLLGLVAACSLPLTSANNHANVTFHLTVPYAVSFSPAGGRMVTGETAQLRLTVQTPSKADEVFTFQPTATEVTNKAFTVTAQTSPGAHTIVVEALSSIGVVLTASASNVILNTGSNSLSLTLLPPVSLAPGSNVAIPAGISYFTVPALPGIALDFQGAGSRFWEASSAGNVAGTGDLGSFVLDPSGSDRYLRVDQSVAGTVNVVQPQVASVVFSEPAGSSNVDLSVSLSTTTSGASISYTINGGASTTYSGPISVAGNGTVSSIIATASRPGFLDATSSPQVYTINWDQVSDVVFNPVAGTYPSDQNVTLTNSTPGSTIEYSTDGGTTYNSYTTGQTIPVAGNGTAVTLETRATKAGLVTALSGPQTYGIQYPAITIDFALPTEPVILGSGNNVALDKGQASPLQVTLDNAADFDSYIWFIDGHTDTYEGTDPSVPLTLYDGKSLLVESQYLSLGRHEIAVVATDATGTYSARFLVEVIE